jgi:SAM-dependent methyltransferase
MEKLTYEDNFFDIVHCLNALDHTRDALTAVKEMIRVCKPGGYVYIDCHLDQLDTGHLHYWNAKEDGTLTNYKETFDLKDFGFQIKYINEYDESRYNHIIAVLQKK